MGFLMQLLGLLTALIFVAEGLKRLGIDVGWLNPLTFFRRRAWQKKVSLSPLYALEHPVDVAGVLALAVAECAGPQTEERRAATQALLAQHLGMQEKDAQDLWLASAHLLRAHPLATPEVPAMLQKSSGKFTAYHRQTLLALMQDVAARTAGGQANVNQQALIEAVERFFQQQHS